MKDLSDLSLNIGSLQAHYRSGTLAPTEVIREVYRRIRALQGNPVWINLVPEEESLVAAEALTDATMAPLFGIPFAIKDNIHAANLPTTAGWPAFSYTAERDATVVRQLKSAGAILIGKTKLDQFATGLEEPAFDALVVGPYAGSFAPTLRIPLDRGLCGTAARTGKTVVVNNVVADPRYLGADNIKSNIVVPIFVNKRVIAELDIESYFADTFPAAEQKFIESCAALVERFLAKQSSTVAGSDAG